MTQNLIFKPTEEVPTLEALNDTGIYYTDIMRKFNGFWLWNCENVPDPLPGYLRILDINLMDSIGKGIPQEDAQRILLHSQRVYLFLKRINSLEDVQKYNEQQCEDNCDESFSLCTFETIINSNNQILKSYWIRCGL